MKHEIEDLGNLKYRLKIEVEAEDVKKERLKLAREYAPHINLRGFRPGKAPIEMVIRHLGPDLDREVREHSIGHALQHAIDEHGLKPSTEPKVDLDENAGEAIRFTAEFESYPKIELKDYLGVQVEEPQLPGITDDDVTQSLERMQQSAARYEKKAEDAVACENDLAFCAVTLRTADGDGILKEESDMRIVAGMDDEPVKDVGREILGLKAGEEKAVTGEAGSVTLKGLPPVEGTDPEAPRTVQAVIKVKELLGKQSPALDDDFAKKYGRVENLDALKSKVREQLENGRQASLKEKLRDAVLDAVVKANPVDLGMATIERLARLAEEEAKERLLPGMSPEDRAKIDLGMPREKTEAEARESLTRMVILQAVAEKEGIDVDVEDLEKKLAELAEETGIPLPRLKARLSQDQAEGLVRRMKLDKTMDLLMRYAVVARPSESVIEAETAPAPEGAAPEAPAETPAMAPEAEQGPAEGTP